MPFFHVVLVNSCSDVVVKIKMMSFFHVVLVNILSMDRIPSFFRLVSSKLMNFYFLSSVSGVYLFLLLINSEHRAGNFLGSFFNLDHNFIHRNSVKIR